MKRNASKKPRATGQTPKVPNTVTARATAHMAHLKKARARKGRRSDRTSAKADTQRAFLAAFAKTGNIRATCELTGVGRRTHYNWLETDAAYAEDFDDAKDEAVDRLELEARRRALFGVEEPVYGKLPGAHAGTGVVGTIRRTSDTLLIFLLKNWRPEVYKERHELTGRNGAPLNPPATFDLSKLTNAELIALEQLVLKSTPDAGGEAKLRGR